MFKRILTFSLAVWLAACAGGRVKEIPADVRDYKRVDFFTQGRTQAAFNPYICARFKSTINQ